MIKSVGPTGVVAPQTAQEAVDAAPSRPPLTMPLAPLLVAAEARSLATDVAFARAIKAVGGGTRRVTVAMLDGGFDTTQPVLKGRVQVMQSQEGLDALSLRHGTHVAGLVTQGTPQIDALGFSRPQGPIGPALVAAIERAVSDGARVVNMSFGVQTRTDFMLLRDAIARHPSVLFVVAAGNTGSDVSTSDEMIAQLTEDSFGFLSFAVADRTLDNLVLVAAADQHGALSESSNYGAPVVHVAAPGVNVLSSVPGGFAYESGTSMAAPQVSNLAAKCLLLKPSLTPAQVKALLIETSSHNNGFSGKIVAAGPIDPSAAFAALTRNDL